MENIIVFLFSFVLSIFIGIFLIPILKRKKLDQTIRIDGPKSHLCKSGTPTMGGLIFLIPILLIGLFLKLNPLIPLITVIAYGVIGGIDDYNKRISKKSGGIRAKTKLIAQIVMGLLIATITYFIVGSHYIGFTKDIFFEFSFPIFVVFIIIFLISVTNAVNLTDGLDGLLSYVSLPIIGILLIISLDQKNYPMAVILSGTLGALIGFLVFNRHPARIFMGDTGSLALGGLIAGTAIVLKVEFLILIFGIVYIIETLSVILQVSYFKLTKGKRIFKMAPIHHHLEIIGFSENKINLLLTLISLAASIVSLILYWSV